MQNIPNMSYYKPIKTFHIGGLIFGRGGYFSQAQNLKPCKTGLNQWGYLEGHGDLVSRLIMGIIRVVKGHLGVINLYLLSSHDPPSPILI